MNIAAVVKDRSMSQNSFYMIKAFNSALSNPSVSAGAFYQRSSIPATQPLFGTKICSHLASYQGVVIATSLELAEMCLKVSSNIDIYLYIWELDWLDNPVYFDTAMSIIRDERIKILARSQSHADCIENFCNKQPVAIIDNWDMGQILGMLA